MQPIPRRWRRAFIIAALGSAILAVPAANAEILAVDDNRNVGIFHNIDFVAGFGWEVGQPLTVEVFRNGQRIGMAEGPTVAVDEGLPLQGALEVNHGPAGAPQPGDCWTNYTPDIMPGDEVRMTQGVDVDSVLIDPITVDRGPFLNSAGKVQVEGRASRPDGTPIPIAFLDSGSVLNTSQFRGGPNEIFRTPGTTDGVTMIFDPASRMDDPGRDGREPDGLSTEDRRALLMAGEYTIGYGHVAPLPRETQLFEGNADTPGPALGCEASPSESNAVTSTDDAAVNASSGDLVVDGKAMAGTFDDDITEVVPKLSDGTTTISGGPIDVTGAVRTWTHTFARADLETLADGPLTVSADYVTSAGPIGGHTKSLTKDVAVPGAPGANPGSGSYVGTQQVALSGESGATIRYTIGGSDVAAPTASSGTVANGAIAVTASQTIRAVVIDAAGNMSPVSTFAYTITAPVPQNTAGDTATGADGSGGGTSVVIAPLGAAPTTAQSTSSKLALKRLSTAARVKRSVARVRGIGLKMELPDGANVVKINIYRKVAGGKLRLISSGFKAPSTSGVYSVRQNHAALKRLLTVGGYEVQVTPGASRNDLGATRKASFKIVP
ncbi:MAG TPA: chitobiase/beta-hexosaminidase C-terminal domain-containing protein [Solirubrobacteraceae bacterium]|nr:chitobiase/beta-hexosaminidase C-terminal domain-containing protein [Solirubrobacteraceae bacterium]